MLRLADNTQLEPRPYRTLKVRYNVKIVFAREERPRLTAHKNPPSKVVTRQPNLLMRAPDTRPKKLVSAIASEPTQAKKSNQANVQN